MYIAIKKRSNRANESLAVFEFVSKKEAEDFFTGMNKFIENDGILQELKEMATEPLKSQDVMTNMLMIHVPYLHVCFRMNLKNLFCLF